MEKNPQLKKNASLTDAACKNILANKYILAWILQASFHEFENRSIEVIANELIEGDVMIDEELGSKEINPAKKIIGLNQEITDPSHGSTHFDLFFSALTSKRPKKGMLINVEAQGYDTDYPIINRIIVYCGQMFHMQKNTIFTNSHYEKLRKVGSVWIFTNSSKEEQGTIVRLSLNQEQIKGNFQVKKADYDKMDIVMIHVPHNVDQETAKTDVLSLLSLLLCSEYTSEEVVHYLKNKYNFPALAELESEVQKMCSYSQGVYNCGIDKGIDKGIDIGVNIGREQGIDIGREQGMNETKCTIAKQMYADGFDLAYICKLTGFSEETLKDILCLEKVKA
jgi:predicted transposase/invertase (TIGR01784 family)